MLEAERGEVFDKLRQTEESPRVRLHARVRSLAFPAQALAVLQEQELDEAQRELEGLEAVDAPNWFDRFVPDTNELHGTVGILIQRLRSAYPQFDQLFGLASELELARRDHATQGNFSAGRWSRHDVVVDPPGSGRKVARRLLEFSQEEA